MIRGNTASLVSVRLTITMGSFITVPCGTTTTRGSGPKARFRYPNRSTGFSNAAPKYFAPSSKSPTGQIITPASSASFSMVMSEIHPS